MTVPTFDGSTFPNDRSQKIMLVIIVCGGIEYLPIKRESTKRNIIRKNARNICVLPSEILL
jgi:hypothetical protein